MIPLMDSMRETVLRSFGFPLLLAVLFLPLRRRARASAFAKASTFVPPCGTPGHRSEDTGGLICPGADGDRGVRGGLVANHLLAKNAASIRRKAKTVGWWFPSMASPEAAS